MVLRALFYTTQREDFPVANYSHRKARQAANGKRPIGTLEGLRDPG